MPITRCPGCGANLEVPSVVPGGRVACPHCNAEFDVGGGGGGGGRARRGGGGRGGGRGYDEPEGDRYGRRGYRKRQDPLPIIILVGSVVVLAGAGIFFWLKGRANEAKHEAEHVQTVQGKQEAFRTINRVPDNPNGDAWDLRCDFRKDDLLTIQELSFTSGLDVKDSSGGSQPVWGLSYRMVTEEHGEKIVEAAGTGETTHEGRYQLQSFMEGTQSRIPDPLWLDARFRTGPRGNPIPGSFSQTGGPTVSPPPTFLADRGFGILPDHPVRMKETYGTSSLVNPFAAKVNLDGRSIDTVPLVGARVGGWRLESGTIQYEPDGKTIARNANLVIHLSAYENRAEPNGTFRGRPARISVSTLWQGNATYDLYKNYLSNVQEMKVTIWVVAKTAREWWEWRGTASTNYKMYKDP